MNLTHIHLLLNHFPTVGMIIAVGLFAASLIMRNEHLKRMSLVVLFGLAVLTIPTYVSGNSAQMAICVARKAADPCKDLSVSKAMIEAHEGAALLGFAVMILTGAFAWLGLWQYRRFTRLPGWNAAIILLLSVITFGLMAQAANLGGEIRHSEIREVAPAPATPAPAIGLSLSRQYGDFVQGNHSANRWVWATLQTLHFLGLTLMFGVAAVVDLRMLGMMKSISFTALHRFIPWAILGFGIDLITGMSYFVGAPWQYATSILFQLKIALIMLASLNVAYFTVFDEVWVIGAGDNAPFTARAVAASALALMFGILYCGHMLPFLGKAF
jgi:uncharacterized membrane protein